MATNDSDDPKTPSGSGDASSGDVERTLPAHPAEEPVDRTLPAGPPRREAEPPAASDGPESGIDATIPAEPPESIGRSAPREKDRRGLIGRTIGGCRVDALLGEGAMGAVYKARQLKLDRDVALKIIRPELMTDPRIAKRFEVEARTVGKFNSANVVLVHDVGVEQGLHYLVMEFVQGQNLREYARSLPGGRLPPGDAIVLLRQACAGLEEARRLGVVHRDIKPDNLMLTEQGVLKITDFGIAKPKQDDFNMTLTSELIGTPLYMSPEQCQGRGDIDFRSDMYSLGASFFYLLTGEPPFRASSVYELIETKTKLEHLCLWKALPELHEDNPLSRVIEHMTANDREDRYASYEELLEDLAIVQEGGTITLPAKKPQRPVERRRPAQKQKAQKKKSKGPLVAVLLVLVLGGGAGAYWFSTRPAAKPEEQAPGPVIDSEAALAAGREGLRRFRLRLRESGASGSLRDEVAAFALPGLLESDRARLLDDIAAAEATEQRLAGVSKPAQLQLPFEGLERYFASVDAAAALGDDASDDVRTFVRRRTKTARAEPELGALARAELVRAFSAWQRDRRNATDAETLGALGTRLESIEQAHARLAVLLPEQREQLEQALPALELGEARRQLTERTVLPADRDVGGALAEIAAELAENGPSEAVLHRARDLQPTREDQVEERSRLLNAIDEGRKYEVLARGKSRPTSPQPPFEDLAGYWREVDGALAKLRSESGELPPWAARLRDELRAEETMRELVIGACRTRFEQLQQRAGAKAPVAELERLQAELQAALAGALRLFPAASETIEAAVPGEQLAQLLEDARVRARRQAFLRDVAAAEERVAGLRQLAAWRGVSGELDRELARLTGVANELGDDEARQALSSVEAACGRWRAAEQKLGEIARSLAQGDLSACRTELNVSGTAREGRDEFRAIATIVEQCGAAFETLEKTLDVELAQRKLASARAELTAIAGLSAGIEAKLLAWERGLAALQRAASGLVAIPAGRSREGGVQVAAFFLAPTEVSYDDFARFVGELRTAAVGGDAQARFAAVEERLRGSEMDAGRLQKLLDRRPREGRQPVDHLTWYEAAAYAAWHGGTLPSKAEWALAAFGDGGEYEYPWGNEWSTDPRHLNIHDRTVEVDRGGMSWRSKQGIELHHLAGNVAEWLDAEAGDRFAPVAGGRSIDARDVLRRQARGEFERQRKDDDGVRGVGFRVALRARSFAGLAWPR